MHPSFVAAVESLHPSFERLLAMAPVTGAMFGKALPKKGIYLFSEGVRHLYVGRTTRLRSRYGEHTNPSSSHDSAPFAFKLARESTGRIRAAYQKGEDSRAGLTLDPDFSAAFVAAKIRIRAMNFRYVEETNPTKQAFLEMYCCVVLETPYNDFDTH